SQGGKGNAGVIFSFDPSSSTFTKVKDFTFKDGGAPNGSLVKASDGKLYGMAKEGGNITFERSLGSGVIFSFDPSNSTYKVLKAFNYTDVAAPNGSLLQA